MQLHILGVMVGKERVMTRKPLLIFRILKKKDSKYLKKNLKFTITMQIYKDFGLRTLNFWKSELFLSYLFFLFIKKIVFSPFGRKNNHFFLGKQKFTSEFFCPWHKVSTQKEHTFFVFHHST